MVPDIQAGLLAPGSTYRPRLPIPLKAEQWLPAAFVPGYSGGTALVLHKLPYYPAGRTCISNLSSASATPLRGFAGIIPGTETV